MLVACWPAMPILPGAGFDRSWEYGMTWAVRLGAHWGTDVKWTYGPLGFLEYPSSSSYGLLLASTAVTAAALLGQSAVLWRLWPTVSTTIRALLVLVSCLIVSIISGDWLAADFGTAHSPLLTLGVFAGVLALLSARSRDLLYFSSSAAVLLLMKATDAVEVMCIGGLLLVAGAAPIRHRLLAVLTPVAGAGLILVIEAGPRGAWEHLRSTLALTAAYAGALGKSEAGRAWEVPAFIALSSLLLVLWVLALRARARPSLAGGAWLLVLLALGGRAAFVRHDRHSVLAFELLIVLGVALLPVTNGVIARTGVGAVVFLAVAALLSSAGLSTAILDRRPGLNALADDARLLASPSVRAQVHRASLKSLLDDSGMSAATAAMLRGHVATSTDFDVPLLDAVGARWVPLPVLAPLSAYTPDLDRAEQVALSRFEPLLLRRALPISVDGRNPLWDAPQFQTALACRYRQRSSGGDGWVVLAPAPNRCGAPVNLGERVLDAGVTTTVPFVPGALVVADLVPMPPLRERLQGVVTRPPVYTINLDGQLFRLPSLAGSESMLLRVPTDVLGYVGRVPAADSEVHLSLDVDARIRFVALPLLLSSARG